MTKECRSVLMGSVIIFSAFTVSQHLSAEPLGNKVKPSEHSIQLSIAEESLVLGQQITLKVNYRNDTKVPWEIADPATSVSVRVRYRPVDSEERSYGYSIGKIGVTTIMRPDGNVTSVQVMPVTKQITIAPQAGHGFEEKFERDWTGNLMPGTWVVWIEDDSLKLESNRVEIPVRFTTASLDACLEIAADKKQPVWKRAWHGKWLKTVMPTLDLTWWSENPVPRADELARLEDAIQRNLETFRAFAKKKENAKSIDGAIATINRKAEKKQER